MNYLVIVHFTSGSLPFTIDNVDGKVTAISQAIFDLLPAQQARIEKVEVFELFNEIKKL